ncbi:MAG: DNA-deoxyinosine glycosylase [Bacilli bacterium]|nr:DNA-deoxyinosine glycosylase [Bacilli bacterium]
MIKHNIDPLYNNNSRILILGSFPSVKSREAHFFYHHPQNRFWKIIESLFNEDCTTIDKKKKCLLQNNIALWDVIESCEIEGSSDSSIKNVKINDLTKIINESKIKTVFTNGKKSYQLYNKYCYSETKINAISLPSTSPANAIYSLDRLIEEWSIIKDYL